MKRSKPPERWEVILTSEPIKDTGKREREIMERVEAIVYPIIRDECKHLDIMPPRIEWVISLIVEGKGHKGAYHHGSRERMIYISSYTITVMLEDNAPERDIIARVVRSCLHELSHYVDDEFHKASLGDIVKNYKYYEMRADEYAESLMPPKIEETLKS